MHVGWWIRCHVSLQILASPNSTFTITFETFDTDINCLWLFFSASIAKLHYEWQLYPHQEQKYTNIKTWRALMLLSNTFFTFDDLLIQITDTRWSDLVPANNRHNTHFTNGKTIYIILFKDAMLIFIKYSFLYGDSTLSCMLHKFGSTGWGQRTTIWQHML